MVAASTKTGSPDLAGKYIELILFYTTVSRVSRFLTKTNFSEYELFRLQPVLRTSDPGKTGRCIRGPGRPSGGMDCVWSARSAHAGGVVDPADSSKGPKEKSRVG